MERNQAKVRQLAKILKKQQRAWGMVVKAEET